VCTSNIVRYVQDDDHRDLEARIAQLFSRSSSGVTSKPRGSVSGGGGAGDTKHRSTTTSHSGHDQQPTQQQPAQASSRRHHRRSHIRTQPYNDTDEQVMDDEELHSLLGV